MFAYKRDDVSSGMKKIIVFRTKIIPNVVFWSKKFVFRLEIYARTQTFIVIVV